MLFSMRNDRKKRPVSSLYFRPVFAHKSGLFSLRTFLFKGSDWLRGSGVFVLFFGVAVRADLFGVGLAVSTHPKVI